jgi:hypothetical protein
VFAAKREEWRKAQVSREGKEKKKPEYSKLRRIGQQKRKRMQAVETTTSPDNKKLDHQERAMRRDDMSSQVPFVGAHLEQRSADRRAERHCGRPQGRPQRSLCASARPNTGLQDQI